VAASIFSLTEVAAVDGVVVVVVASGVVVIVDFSAVMMAMIRLLYRYLVQIGTLYPPDSQYVFGHRQTFVSQ
jgi:hypothetical protein